MFLLMLACLLLGGCFPVLMVGAFATAPWMPDNLPTCNMLEPIHARCREVKGQWGGTMDGRIWQHYHPKEGRTP